MNSQLRLWLHGLIVALISAIGDGGSAAVGACMVGVKFLQDPQFWFVLGGMIVVSALKAVFLYMKQSPIPLELQSQMQTKQGSQQCASSQ